MFLSYLFLSSVAYSTTYYVKKDGSDESSGTSWDEAFLTITKALDEVTSGDAVWVAEGNYQEGRRLRVDEGVSLYGGFAGYETNLSQRNIGNYKTIIDGEKRYDCIDNYGLLDGLYVTNGNGGYTSGGIYIYKGTVNNCIVYCNTTLGQGGGIFNYLGSVTNCTVYGNTAHEGGGIYNYYGGSMTNCICWNNVNDDVYKNRSVDVSYSCFTGSRGNHHNISANPLFVNTSGDPSTWDFHLQNGSPCIDSANPDMAPDIDIEGNPRPGTDGKVCMGAYESPDVYEPAPPRVPGRLYVSKMGNNTDGTSWENAYTSITTSLLNLPGDDLYDIWVAEGLYQERISLTVTSRSSLYGGFAGYESDLSQRDIENHETIIDGKSWYRCIKNYGLVDGLYVTNGYTDRKGGGIYNYRGSVINCIIYSNTGEHGGGIYNDVGSVNNCRVYTNISNEDGGGIYSNGGSVDNCIVYSNTGEYAGGIDNSHGSVTNCKVYNNKSSQGGGIVSVEGSVKNCTVYDNLVKKDRYYAWGGGIYNYEGPVINCMVYSNTADNGGGIYNYRGSVTNSMVFSNTAVDNGGGIYNEDGSIYNCTVYGNTAYSFGGGIYDDEGSMHNSISWSNVGGDFYGKSTNVSYSCFGESRHKHHSIRANPQFVNTSGDPSTWDFQLQNGSPCIDSANPGMAPDNDIEGNPRPGTDGKVCMGAYESPDGYEPAPPQPPLRLYVSEKGNNTNGSSWEDAFTSITTAISNLDDNIYDIWVAKGLYQEGAQINVPGRASLYGGFEGHESELSQRNIEKYKTTIDGENSYGCVYNSGMIDGFYVRNGNRYSGGGINNSNGSVNNCILYNNTAGNKGGGGIANYYGTVKNCKLHLNTSNNYGGGVSNYKGSLFNCIIQDNFSDDCGGGIANYSGSVTNCRVFHNSSLHDEGGGIDNIKGALINCIVYRNTGVSGGGIYNDEGSVTNCLVYDNLATLNIDGIYNENGQVINCTTCWNWSYGIYNENGSVINCISWNHSQADMNGNLTDVSYSCFYGAKGDNHNISTDPLFVKASGDPSSLDLHLQSGSPCIDAGTGEGAPDHDLEGVPRPQGSGFDMGAYEFPLDNARFISQHVSSKIPAGEQFGVSLIMKNIGINTWTKGGGYQLGDCITTDSLWGLSRVDLAPGETVMPDETTSFTFNPTAPETGGEYDFQWRMIKEPEEKWFGEKTPLVRIRVVEWIPGDVNNDGYLTLEDINMLIDHLLGKTMLDPDEAERADANLDDKLDAGDLIRIVMGRSDLK